MTPTTEELAVGVDKIAAEMTDEAWALADGKDKFPKVHTLRLAARRLRAGEALAVTLTDIASKAPTEEPERYEGDNHGDSHYSGWERGEFHSAQKIRAALNTYTLEKDQ